MNEALIARRKRTEKLLGNHDVFHDNYTLGCPACKVRVDINRTSAASVAVNAIAGIFSPAPVPKGFLR